MTSSLAERHKTDQAKLARLLAADVAPLVVPQPGRTAVKALLDVLAAAVLAYNRASASLAADYFDAERAAAGMRGLAAPVADPPNDDQVVHALGWATRDLADRAVDLDAVRQRVDAAGGRLALAGGRDTITHAAAADQKCVGYVRVADPDACAFCALLATRVFDVRNNVQAVYRSAESAMFKGNERERLPHRGGGLRRKGVKYAAEQTYSTDPYHSHCRCTVQPIFAGQRYEPPEHVAAWNRLYSTATRGHDGSAKLTAFRAALVEQRGEH